MAEYDLAMKFDPGVGLDIRCLGLSLDADAERGGETRAAQEQMSGERLREAGPAHA